MTSAYVINQKDKRLLNDVINTIKDSTQKNVVLLVVQSRIDTPLLDEKNFNLQNISEYNEYRKTTRPEKIFTDLIMKDSKSSAFIGMGYIVLEVPNEEKLEEDLIGFDFFPSKAKTIEYLNSRGVIEKGENKGRYWDFEPRKKNAGNQTTYESSYFFDSSDYFLVEMEKIDAIQYINDLSGNNSAQGKFIKQSKMKNSTFYVIECEKLNVDIQSDDDNIYGYPGTKQRLLYLFEVFSKWIEDFKKRWFEVSSSERFFQYTVKKILGWGDRPEIKGSFTTSNFRKDFNFYLSPFWHDFFIPNLSAEKKCKIVLELLSFYDVNSISMENLIGGLSESINIQNFLRNVGSLTIAEPKSQTSKFIHFNEKRKAISHEKKEEEKKQKQINNVIKVKYVPQAAYALAIPAPKSRS